MIQIQISDEIWKFLNKEKRVGETFDEVLRRKLMFKKKEVTENENN